MGRGRAKSSVEATRTAVEEKAAAVRAIESSIREAEKALAAAEQVVRRYADERGSLDDQVLELGAEVFRDRVAEADRKVQEATIEAGRHRASIVAFNKKLELAREELLRAEAEAAKENARRKRIHDLALVQFVVDEGRWPPQQKAAAEIAALSDEERAEFDAALGRIREGREAERANLRENAAKMGYAYLPEGGIGAVEFPEPVPMPPAA